MASIYIALICLFAVNVHAKLTRKELLDTLTLTAENKKDAFEGLDVTKDNVINMDDLDKHYFHKDTGFAKAKFIDFIDKKTKDGKVVEEELNDFLDQKPVTAAVWECTYVRSKSLKQYCFLDQLCVYIYLVLDHAAMQQLFKYIEGNKDGNNVIEAPQVAKLATLNPAFTAAEQENFLIELGGADKKITCEEFIDYMKQESIQNDMRECRVEMHGWKGVYNDECMAKGLMHYTMDDLTELDIATTFGELDHEDTNDETSLVKDDFIKNSICSEAVAERLIHIMDKTGDGSISYGEFRAFMWHKTVSMHLERVCSRPKHTQAEEIACYKEAIIKFAVENYTPIWLDIPDLDMVILFEELDHNDDGQIKIMDDLVNGKNWDQGLASKLVTEMDGPDDDKDVNMEEFNDYVNQPNMVYALGECYFHPSGHERMTCYETKLKEIITHMMDKSKVQPFFEFYDTDRSMKITKDELEKKGVTGAEADNMLTEMGMGDMEINYIEFKWYVRQLELSKMFGSCDHSPKELHPILLKYLAEVMTEWDIQELFKKLDTNHNHEIECSDFATASNAVINLLGRMDQNGDRKINFVEFRTYWKSPLENPRKLQLEKACTEPKATQEEEIECYKSEMLNVN